MFKSYLSRKKNTEMPYIKLKKIYYSPDLNYNLFLLKPLNIGHFGQHM